MPVIVRYDQRGEPSYHCTDGDTLYIVDERTPHDRVYRYTPNATEADIANILKNSEIGHSGDSRHEAITNRVLSLMDGKPFLRPVPADE